MTIVCGYKDPVTGEVWIGADSASVSGGYRFQAVERKIVRFGDWWVGVAGLSRGIEVIEATAESYRGPNSIRAIVDEIFAGFERAGFAHDDDRKAGPPCYKQQIIIARPGKLFDIGEDGTVGEPSWGFVACGSGAPWAEGAAWLMHEGNKHKIRTPLFAADAIIDNAIRAALNFRTDCGGEIVIERVG